ncbi:hypothetical protein BDR26DRAFT_935390 [Obelidium mucronatum]|nr:hypothetical protein BDR26DRAFT_935390 [Obelidium mucronatum]
MNPNLFIDDDGEPLRFSIARFDRRGAIRLLIEQNGGEVVEPHEPNIFMKISSLKLARVPGRFYSEKYIVDSIQRGRLPVNRERYLLWPSKPIAESASHGGEEKPGKRPQHEPPGFRTPFTKEEDALLIQLIAKNRDGLTGDLLYQELARTHPSRTWSSWRDRAVKKLLPRMSADYLSRLREEYATKAAAAAAAAAATAASDSAAATARESDNNDSQNEASVSQINLLGSSQRQNQRVARDSGPAEEMVLHEEDVRREPPKIARYNTATKGQHDVKKRKHRATEFVDEFDDGDDFGVGYHEEDAVASRFQPNDTLPAVVNNTSSSSNSGGAGSSVKISSKSPANDSLPRAVSIKPLDLEGASTVEAEISSPSPPKRFQLTTVNPTSVAPVYSATSRKSLPERRSQQSMAMPDPDPIPTTTARAVPPPATTTAATTTTATATTPTTAPIATTTTTRGRISTGVLANASPKNPVLSAFLEMNHESLPGTSSSRRSSGSNRRKSNADELVEIRDELRRAELKQQQQQQQAEGDGIRKRQRIGYSSSVGKPGNSDGREDDNNNNGDLVALVVGGKKWVGKSENNNRGDEYMAAALKQGVEASKIAAAAAAAQTHSPITPRRQSARISISPAKEASSPTKEAGYDNVTPLKRSGSVSKYIQRALKSPARGSFVEPDSDNEMDASDHDRTQVAAAVPRIDSQALSFVTDEDEYEAANKSFDEFSSVNDTTQALPGNIYEEVAAEVSYELVEDVLDASDDEDEPTAVEAQLMRETGDSFKNVKKAMFMTTYLKKKARFLLKAKFNVNRLDPKVRAFIFLPEEDDVLLGDDEDRYRALEEQKGRNMLEYRRVFLANLGQ